MDSVTLREHVEKLRAGDLEAFEVIYRELKTPVYTVLLRITRDEALSEDLLQELFLKLFQSPPPPSVKNPRAYLFQMARNLALDSLRGRQQFEELEESLAARTAEDLAVKLDVAAALRALPLLERQIVALHLNGGLKFRELAEMMDLPLGTVLWRYRRAIEELRRILSGGVR